MRQTVCRRLHYAPRDVDGGVDDRLHLRVAVLHLELRRHRTRIHTESVRITRVDTVG